MAQGDPDRDGPDRRLVFQRGRARGVGDPREVDVRGALRVDDVRRRVWRVCRFSTHPRGRRHARRLRTPRVSTAPFERARADAVERVARREPRLWRAERSRDASSRTRRGRGTSTRVRARRSTYVGRFRRRSRRSRRSRRGGFREEGRAFPGRGFRLARCRSKTRSPTVWTSARRSGFSWTRSTADRYRTSSNESCA